MVPSRRPAVPTLVAALLLPLLTIWPAGSGCAGKLGKRMEITVPGNCLELHQERVLAQRTEGGGMAGRGKLRFHSSQGRARASFDFFLVRPDTLRLQFRSPLGPVVAVLDLRGGRYLFADFNRRFYVEGREEDGQFEDLTGLPIPPRTLMTLLLAEPLPDEDQVRLTGFDPDTCLPAGCRLAGGVEVVYSHQIGELLPRRVVFHGPGARQQTTIRFFDVRPLTEDEQAAEIPAVELDGLEKGHLTTIPSELPTWVGP